MQLEQKRELYMKGAKVFREYSAKDIMNITEKDIRFSDGYWLDLMECKVYFPIKKSNTDQYVGARFSGVFWQFFVEKGSVVILCDSTDDYYRIFSAIGFSRSFDLS